MGRSSTRYALDITCSLPELKYLLHLFPCFITFSDIIVYYGDLCDYPDGVLAPDSNRPSQPTPGKIHEVLHSPYNKIVAAIDRININ